MAKEWKGIVHELREASINQRANYEGRITALEEANEKLREENEELRSIVTKLRQVEEAFRDQQRQLKIGQIAFNLERLVAKVVFPGPARLRYGIRLKDVQNKVNNLKDESQKRDARARLESIPQGMFEDWVIGMTEEIRDMRLGPAHPDLGRYEEVIADIKCHYEEDQDRCDDLITIVNYLKELYEKQKLPFGANIDAKK